MTTEPNPRDLETACRRLQETGDVGDADHVRELINEAFGRPAGVCPVRTPKEPDVVVHPSGGVTVKTSTLANQVYRDADETYSVNGYGQRSRQCFGEIYLGLDDGPEYQRQSSSVNVAISRITAQEAFQLALAETRKTLSLVASPPAADATTIVRVLAALCRVWFAIPDGDNVSEGGITFPFSPPHCPGSYMLPSAYMFSPDPDAALAQNGIGFGQALKPAVERFVAKHIADKTTPSAPLARAVFDAFAPHEQELIARTLSGIMMGMLPTVFVNLTNVLAAWPADRRAALRAELDKHSGTDAYLRAKDVLLKPLMQAIQSNPIPVAVWRTATRTHAIGSVSPVRVSVGDKVRVDITAATRGDLAAGITDVFTVFGGSRKDAPHPTHACPGYAMAMGMMLGFVTAVIESSAAPAAT